MLRAALTLLAKKKPPLASASRKKVLKRVGRSGSKTGHGPSARRLGNSPTRTVSRDASVAKGAGGAAGAPGSDGVGGDATRTEAADAIVRVSSEESRTPASATTSSAAASRAMAYRLATAVSTVVVPSLANAYLESMKQTLTPAARRPPESGTAHADGRGPESAPAAPMEEYYTSRKGPLFATAVIAGTHAVKQASALIPFCHPIPIQKCSFTFRRRVVSGEMNRSALPHRVVLRRRRSPPSPRPGRPAYSVLYCFCTVATEEYKTGVEMEALTGATVAAMTLYDMLKGLPGAQEDGLSLGESFVLAKRGGRNDFIKLLMSEPERAEAARSSPAPAAIEEGARNANGVGQRAGSGGEAAVATKEAEAEAAGEEEHTDVDAPAARSKVVHKVPAGEVEGSLGDTGAWWRTTKHEKTLQELFPRRKYGDNARLAPQPTSGHLKAKGRKRSTAAEEEETEVKEEEEVAPHPPVKGHASGGAALPKPKSKAAAHHAKQALREEAEEDAEGDDEGDDVRSRKHRSGQLAKKAARAPAATTTTTTSASRAYAEEEDDDSENEVKAPARRKPPPHSKRTSKAAAARARAVEVTAAVEDEDEDEGEDVEDYAEVEEEEEEDAPVASPARSGRSRAATSVAIISGSGRKKPTPKAASRGSARNSPAPAAEEDNEAAEDDDAEAEEEEEMEQVSLGRDGKVRAVKHDSWSHQTVVEDDGDASVEEEDEEAPPPPPAQKVKKKKKLMRRS